MNNNSILFKIFYNIKQGEFLELRNIKQYYNQLFTTYFYFTNKIEIRKIRIKLHWLLSNEDVKNICSKICKKIRSLETQNIISNDVSLFY